MIRERAEKLASLIVRLKKANVEKSTVNGRLFHTFTSYNPLGKEIFRMLQERRGLNILCA